MKKIITVVILLAIIVGGYVIFNKKTSSNRGGKKQVESGFIAGKTPTKTPSGNITKEYEDDIILYTSNSDIKQVFQSFWKVAKNNNESHKNLCEDDSINTTNTDLANIAKTIINNRVTSLDPLEYASTQKEAGITCITSGDKWVLFSILNNHSKNNGKNFYCTDSSGKNGNLNIDIENIQCGSN